MNTTITGISKINFMNIFSCCFGRKFNITYNNNQNNNNNFKQKIIVMKGSKQLSNFGTHVVVRTIKIGK